MDTIRTKRHRHLIDLLKIVRKKRKVSQTDLARALKTTQTSITRMENHGRRIDVVEFLILCEELELDAVKIIKKIQAVGRD